MTNGTLPRDSPRMIFNHVPKTGGISLLSVCKQNLASSEISPHLTEDRARTAPAGRFDRYRLIAGHFSIPSQGRLAAGRYSMTMLREPIRRICSLYSYWRDFPEYTEMTGIAKRFPFPDFVRYLVDSPTVVHDSCTFHFAGVSGVSGYTGDEVSLLAAAKQNLSAFDFIGITEDMGRSVRLLCADLGWPEPASLPCENRSGSEKLFESIDRETMAILVDRNRLDNQLYDYGAQLLRDRSQGVARSAASRFVSLPATPTPEPKATIRAVRTRWIRFQGEVALEITIEFRAAAKVEDLMVGIEISDAADASLVWGMNTERAQAELVFAEGRESCAVFVVRGAFPIGKYYVAAALQQLRRLGFPEHRVDEAASFQVNSQNGGLQLLEFRSSVISPDGPQPLAHKEEDELRRLSILDASAATALTNDAIASRIAELAPWFHRIDLGNGLTTKSQSIWGEPADHPLSTWEFVKHAVPSDLSGQSVLDVGCNAGFYSIQAKRRGAERVLGVDAGSREIRQASLVRDILGLDIEYRRMSVYNLSPKAAGTFDVTMALGLLYHCKHLLLAVERLFVVTRGLLVVESEVLPDDEALAVRERLLGGLNSSLHALAYVANDSAAQESAHNWFVPSVSGLLAILEDVGFQDAKLVSRFGSRALVTAWNRTEPNSIGHPALLGAELEVLSAPALCRPVQVLPLRVLVRNTGFATWISQAPSGRGSVRLGGYLKRMGQPTASNIPARASLASDLLPGESAELTLPVAAPQEPGDYELELDLVSEYVSWFQDLGASQPVTVRFQVKA
jgi:tRNA (mo5U34)-methyltransferase